MSKTTLQVRLSPTPEQGPLLMAHCMEYISTVNVLVQALESGVLPEKASTKDFQALLPSAVKNQALCDAQSVFKRSFELGCVPILKKPICQWNNQNWRIEDGMLILPTYQDGKTQQIRIRCADVARAGKVGILRIKKKRGKWIADLTTKYRLPHLRSTVIRGAKPHDGLKAWHELTVACTKYSRAQIRAGLCGPHPASDLVSAWCLLVPGCAKQGFPKWRNL